MRLTRSVRISVGALLRHKLRTALALASLVIGVAIVLVMVGVGEGSKRKVLEQIAQLGTDMLIVTAGKTTPTAGRDVVADRVETLRPSDCAAIASECPSVVRTAPAQSGAYRVKLDQYSTMTTILGTTPEFEQIRNAPVTAGRYFTAEENATSQRVAVVGTRVVEKIFQGVDPLGARIRIGSVPFEVVGVLKSKGTSVDGGGDEDNQILVPIRTAMRRLFNVDYLDRVYVQTAGQGALLTAENEIRALLRARHDLEYLRRADDFNIEDQAIALRSEGDAAGSFTAMIIGLAGVSLFVGGVGILSIMIITVKERVGEIGLRLAIGATPRDILLQFMSESLLLGVTGGVVGLALGLGLAGAIGGLTEWATHVPRQWIAAAMSASILLGLTAGVYPAMRAARMDPVDALRAA